MGWFWQSPPRSPAEGKPAPERAQSENQAPPKAQDDSSMDPEIAKFLAQFQAELNGGKEAPAPEPQQMPTSRPAAGASPASSSSSPGSWLSWGSTSSGTKTSSSSSRSGETSPRTTTNPTNEVSGPEAMAASIDPAPSSCRQAFDLAFHCNGLGGQWNAVYRYGALRNCSDQWDDFWFCMRVKGYSPELRAAAYKERQREKDLARYGPGMPSSEDVWVSRDRKVEPGTAFVTPIPAAELDNDLDSVEWSRIDNERRRKVRESLGLQDPQAGAA